MSGGGGSTTTQNVPQYVEDAHRGLIDYSRMVGGLGYVPQYGNDVAAFSPAQNAAFDNTSAAASAFGLSAPMGDNPYMPKPTTDNLGFTGYSSGAMFDQYMDNLKRERRGQYDYMNNMFIDPYTGQVGQVGQGGSILDFLGIGGSGGSGGAGSAGRSSRATNAGSGDYIPPSGSGGISGDAVNLLRKLPNFGLLGMGANALADYYAGDYGKKGNPDVYSGDMFYRSNGVPTPVRGQDFYDSAEAKRNKAAAEAAKKAAKPKAPPKPKPLTKAQKNWHRQRSAALANGQPFTLPYPRSTGGSSSSGGGSSYSSGAGSLGVGGGNASRGFVTGGW